MKLCLIFLTLFLPLSLWAENSSSIRCDPRTGNAPIAEIGKFGRQEEAFTIAKSCISAAGSGLWAATGGKVTAVADTAKGAYNLVTSPVQTMSKMAESMKQTYKALGEVYNQGISFFADLPPTMVTDLVCSMGVGLATENLLNIFTGGANSAFLAAAVLKYLQTIKIMAQIKELAKRLGLSIVELFKSIEGLDSKAREKFHKMLGSTEGQKRAESLLVSCAAR